jgi:hypothetical protein
MSRKTSWEIEEKKTRRKQFEIMQKTEEEERVSRTAKMIYMLNLLCKS